MMSAVWRVPMPASLPLARGQVRAPAAWQLGAMGGRAQRGAGWEVDRQQ